MEANSIKKVVAMGIGAAVYIVLSRFAAIPTPIPNTTLQVTYAFLALMAFIYGTVVGLGVGFIATAFFGIGMGLLGKMIKPENFDKAKAVKFIIGDIIISLLTWVVIAPVLDIVIYKEPQGKVFIQGFAAALSNAFVVAVLGTILIFAFSKTIVSKGSLKKE